MFLKCNILWLKSNSLPSAVLREVWGRVSKTVEAASVGKELFCCFHAVSWGPAAHTVCCVSRCGRPPSSPGRPISGPLTFPAFHAAAFLSTWAEQWSPAVEPAHDLPRLLCAIRHENGGIVFFVVLEDNVSWTQDNNLYWNAGKPHTFVS